MMLLPAGVGLRSSGFLEPGGRVSLALEVTHTGSPPLPQIRYDHLHHLTGPFGVFEHAEYRSPRRGEGYTTDDNARVLVVLADATQPEEEMVVAKATSFVLDARSERGWRNRRSASGVWSDSLGSDDSRGRALWGLAHLAGTDPRVDAAILDLLHLETEHPRANAFATLGAVRAVEHLERAEEGAVNLSAKLPRPRKGPWSWPAPTLTYANARVPQAMIESGFALEDCDRVDDGLELLEWLIGIERGEGWFSFTPVGGKGPTDSGPRFDQQPIEAWAMVDACRSAMKVDGGRIWVDALLDAGLWFLGKNDAGVPLYEKDTGAGFDGLTPKGVNLNRGAESTLAALSVLDTLHQTLGMSTVS